MKEGGKAKLYIPSDIAYGDNPRDGGVIQPGHTLIFEVELIKVEENK
jgi:FKBP-type peptidyl-prolyl cis-trans isomerase